MTVPFSGICVGRIFLREHLADRSLLTVGGGSGPRGSPARAPPQARQPVPTKPLPSCPCPAALARAAGGEPGLDAFEEAGGPAGGQRPWGARAAAHGAVLEEADGGGGGGAPEDR